MNKCPFCGEEYKGAYAFEDHAKTCAENQKAVVIELSVSTAAGRRDVRTFQGRTLNQARGRVFKYMEFLELDWSQE